ncbi:hypothetical protein FXF68_08610 [Actinomadura decatromicini]|uniref:Uncharacterized protein n=1 Tax=Actinomadura decatromicini TaxID=2604572 RepID=A0A5D3FRB6_9ACTN|nr:hypothetical protein FXF68_08610 [Actinomadura decatromicini]
MIPKRITADDVSDNDAPTTPQEPPGPRRPAPAKPSSWHQLGPPSQSGVPRAGVPGCAAEVRCGPRAQGEVIGSVGWTSRPGALPAPTALSEGARDQQRRRWLRRSTRRRQRIWSPSRIAASSWPRPTHSASKARSVKTSQWTECDTSERRHGMATGARRSTSSRPMRTSSRSSTPTSTTR